MDLSKNMIINNKYIIIKKIGEGKFGKIFLSKNKYTNEKVAIKLDTNNILLKNEARIYNYLYNINGIPKLRAYGKENSYNYLIIDLLDCTLIKKRQLNGNKFTFNYVINFGIKIIDIINNIHKKNIIHRDIKPENIMFKNNNGFDNIYIIDFGLSKLYDSNKKNFVNKENIIVGTYNYISLHTHYGFMPSKRDDLESIGYILLYMYYGKLPWNNLLDIKQEKQKLINSNIKNNIFINFIKKCNELKYDENPNYLELKTLLSRSLNNNNKTI